MACVDWRCTPGDCRHTVVASFVGFHTKSVEVYEEITQCVEQDVSSAWYRGPEVLSVGGKQLVSLRAPVDPYYPLDHT